MGAKMADSDHDYAADEAAERQRLEAGSLFRRTGGQDGGYEPTAEETEAELRSESYRLLRFDTTFGYVSDALTETDTPRLLHDFALEHFRNPQSIEPDLCEIGRIVWKAIHDHVRSLAEKNL